MIGIKVQGENGTIKHVRFEKDGKQNKRQIAYFENLFTPSLQLKAQYDEYSYFGAFRCSKSFSQQLSVFLVCLNYPKTKAIYVRDTYDQLKDSVIKQFNDEFEYLGAYEYHKSERKCYFKNGSTLVFRAFDKDTGILSSEYDLAAVCQAEDISQDLFLQLFGRLSGRVLPRPLLLTEGNPASGFVKERYKDQTQEALKKKGIFFLEGQTSDNPWVTPQYIQRLIDNYPKWWLDRYLYGLWDNREELIFSEFNESTMVIDPIDPKMIPSSYTRRNGLDWGWVNPSALGYWFVDYDGNLTLYDEYYQPKTMPEDLARIGNKYGKFLTVADHAMKGLKMPSKDDENKTVWSELERNGMRLIECNKEELSNIVLVNSLMKQGRFKVTRNCANHIKEYKNWKWKRLKLGADKNMPEEPVDKDNHACDETNYVAADLFGSKAPDPKEAEFKKSMQYAVQKKNTGSQFQMS